ncbi:tannase/feruloyl esterase family alpha/beta hydrolase [Mesobaculum littorinae]|uniref:Tannase/feruloyl esterase family alpha/beta hydrolase n=1 Tax=Mesobaculum littorinae TaxID=2486419 RepID=A0A438AM22_9RHOB|nr:DUF6351 family protein [Mesobaculum littorinae]RVV99893.1 tannase/feruloyl esterase family alpha/beta hydrolase [Mesobaculum littorinae]
MTDHRDSPWDAGAGDAARTGARGRRGGRIATASALALCAMLAPQGAAAQDATGPAGGGSAEACAGFTAAMPDYPDLTFTTSHVDAGRARCLIEGSFERRSGVGGDYALGFALALPDDWNGRFLYQGGGGLNGTVRPPEGAAAAGETSAVDRGFAVVSSDSGHQGAVFDPSFQADQIAALNFAQESVPKVTALALKLVEGYYDAAPDYTYFDGCSTGGREAMQAAQRTPLLFDGVLAGAPALRTDHSNTALAAKAIAMNRLAPEAADGSPDRAAVFDGAERQAILDGLLAACDGLDGNRDGMIFAPDACDFDPAVLACEAGEEGACLNVGQVGLVRTMFAPTESSTGRQIYPGYPMDTGVMDMPEGAAPGLFRFDAESNRQAGNTDTESSVDDLVAQSITPGPQQWLINADRWTNLSSFSGNGSKLMLYHGLSDPWFSAWDTRDYYLRLDAAAEGGARDFAALYLVPGMAHCRGGSAGLDRFDMLTPLMAWVEKGTPPEAVTATGAAFEGRERPLCRYPQHAVYDGSGDPQAVESYSCAD